MKCNRIIVNGNKLRVAKTASLVFFINYSSFASFAPHALKGQKPLAQGIALGNYGRKPVAL